MKNETKQKFMNVPGIEEQIAESLISILELKEEQFDAIYPMMVQKLESTYQTEKFQSDMLSQMAGYPLEVLSAQKSEFDDFAMIFDEDDTLSQKKKDLIHIMLDGILSVFNAIIDHGGRTYVNIKITKLNPDATLPKYAHNTDAGADVCAVEAVTIEPGETKIVKTGLAVAIPNGYEIQVRPRSGLSLKTGLRVANAPGTIDTEYRGEIGVIMTNTGNAPYTIEKGERIAQFVLSQVPAINWQEVDTVEDLGSTERGEGGYGSTGTQS